jgi:hypothetical protein
VALIIHRILPVVGSTRTYWRHKVRRALFTQQAGYEVAFYFVASNIGFAKTGCICHLIVFVSWWRCKYIISVWCPYTVEIGYNVMKGTEYFVPL